jgi:hypothetical protein
MPQTAPAESSASGFAGLLAYLAAPQKPSVSPWDDELADDFATISYEKALRTQPRYQPPAAESLSTSALIETSQAVRPSGSDRGPFPPVKERLKTASITVRLSEAECAQIRQRAAEAGLTISAYLRSCTLEVETLRAQVKETLAQLRQSSPTRPAAIAPALPLRPSAAPGIWHRLWPFGSFRRP